MLGEKNQHINFNGHLHHPLRLDGVWPTMCFTNALRKSTAQSSAVIPLHPILKKKLILFDFIYLFSF